MEGVLDRLAEQVGISGWEIRKRNVIRPGRRVGPGPDHGRRLPRRRARASTRSRPAYDAAVAAGKAGRPRARAEELRARQRLQGDRQGRRALRRRRHRRGAPRLDRDGPGRAHRRPAGRGRGARRRPGPRPGRRRHDPRARRSARPPAAGARSWAPARWGGVRGGHAPTAAELGVDYEGEYRVDWTNKLGATASSTRSSTPRSATPRSSWSLDRDDRRDRAGRRRPRRRPGGQPDAVRGPDRGLGAHGPRLRPHRGLPRRPGHRLPHQHDAAAASASSGPRTCRRSTSILVESPQPNAPYGIKGVGEIGLVPTAPARWPPRCTTSTASGAATLPMRRARARG